jgi:sigma-E factor negative regulatory protein RseB
VLSQPRTWFCCFCLLVATQSVWAQSNPRDYLDRMSHSFRELNYRGEFTYEYGSHMDTLAIVHAVRDGIEKERLVYLNGEPREVVRDGHHVSCIHPGDQIMRLGNTIATGPFARSFQGEHEISDHYQLTFGDGTRIAGREALQIVVRAADQYRYGFQLFLDRETGLLLKSLTISPGGKVLERFQFTRIEVGVEIEDSELQALESDTTEAFHYLLEQASTSAEPTLQTLAAGWLPPGFALSASNVSAEGERAVQLSMYTDGFSTLTLVLEPVPADATMAKDGKARRGATVAYLRQLSVDGAPYLLTVVGEVPLVTAKKVAQNVVLEQG